MPGEGNSPLTAVAGRAAWREERRGDSSGRFDLVFHSLALGMVLLRQCSPYLHQRDKAWVLYQGMHMRS